MVRKQEKSDLTGLIKWKFQKVTFFFAHPLTFMEYLDDVIFHASVNSEWNTGQTPGNFIDTNRILNEIEHDKVTPSTPEVNTGTNKAYESSCLQTPQQR